MADAIFREPGGEPMVDLPGNRHSGGVEALPGPLEVGELAAATLDRAAGPVCGIRPLARDPPSPPKLPLARSLLLFPAMAEKRSFARKKRRMLVDFDTETSRGTGFTSDLSRCGIFISAVIIPRIGERLTTRLHLPRGGDVSVTGRVVRSQHRPGALSRTAAHGFALQLSAYNEEYDRFCAAL
jgi:hypothetical protein